MQDPQGPWTSHQQAVLSAIAWSAIGRGLRVGGRLDARAGQPELDALSEREPWLGVPAATFVTLHKDGALRGCIGNLEPHRTLGGSVAYNAAAAAFGDPRFAPLTDAEAWMTTAEISILTAMQPLPVASWLALHAALRPGVDGLVVHSQGRSATFLPAVWEDLPRTDDFLNHLWRKAGLPPKSWDASTQVEVYQADKFAAPRPPSWPEFAA